MKGAKGGKRDRIISFLFSKKNQEIINEKEVEEKEKNNDIQQKEELIEIIIDNIENKEKNINNQSESIISEELVENPIESKENVIKQKPIIIEEKEILVNNIENKEHIINDNKENISEEEIKPSIEHKDNKKIEEKEILIDESNTKDRIIDEEILEKKEKTSEYKEIDIHEEQLKDPSTIVEFAVVEELEKMVRDDYYEIEEIKYELDVLASKEKDEVLYDEVEKLQRQLEILIKRFEEIKRRYEYIYSTIDFDQVNNLQDNYISSMISEYKDSVNGSRLEDFVEGIKGIEEYIIIINQIVDIEKNKDHLKENIDEKLDKYEIRDLEFEKMKDEYLDLEKTNKIFDEFSKAQNQIIKSINTKVTETKTIQNSVERTRRLVPNINNLFNATLMIAASKKIPPTPRGNIMKAVLYASAINAAAHIIEPHEEVRNVQTVTTTYSHEENVDVTKVFADFNGVLSMMDDSLLKLSELKETFKKYFGEFQNQIPEYQEMMKNLEDMEKEMVSKYDMISKYQNEFSDVLKVNNQKVKTIEEETID